MKLHLPYLATDRDRHGNTRIYVRYKGRPKVRLHCSPGTPEFLAEYRAALAGPPAKGLSGDQATVPGSLRYLVQAYYRSPEFRGLDPDTQRVRRAHLDTICSSTVADGRPRGSLPFARMEPRHAREIRDQWASNGPEAANGRLKALRRLFAWAIDAGHAERNPAKDVPKLRGNSEGFHTWSIEEVRQFEARHPIGTKARLALALLLFTGTRRSDVVTLGRQMVRDGELRWTEAKGSTRQRKERTIPILPALSRVIDASPTGTLCYLETAFGRPFTAAGFGNWFRDRCNEAGLPHCSAHGLRKAGATMLANNGASEHQLMAVYGWSSPKQAAIYTRQANRRKLASDAIHLLVLAEQGENESVPPASGTVSHRGSSG
jgi:integrase